MRVQIELTGVSPLICNKFTDAAAEKSSSGSSGASSAADRGTPREIAESKLYIGLEGNPMLPQPNVFRSLVEGGRFHKAGKTQITTARSSVMFACLSINQAEIPIQFKEPWVVDTRAVRIPATGGRILAHRPMFHDWKLDFEVELDTSICGVKLFRQIVDDAGKRIGIGDFRPATKGPFGRFAVTVWRELEDEQAPDVAVTEKAAARKLAVIR